MRNIRIVCVGKIKEKFFLDAIAEYVKRLSRFCKLEIIEVKDFPDEQLPLQRESALIMPKLKGSVFPLCVEGKSYSSEKIAELIDEHSVITFVIGGSNGLHSDIKGKGTPISFSPMTFPHQLMRLILAEQIYRGFKINNNESYHK